jgi:hypothetical protein
LNAKKFAGGDYSQREQYLKQSIEDRKMEEQGSSKGYLYTRIR